MVDFVNDGEGLELLSQAAYAKRIQVSRQRINRLVKDQKIPLHHGRIDPVEADQILEELSHAGYANNRKARLFLETPKPEVDTPPPQHTKENSDQESHKEKLAAGSLTDEQGVDQIFEHLKAMIFNGRAMKDIPHVEIKKLNDFISAVQRKLDIQERAGTLVVKSEAQDAFVQVAGQVREGLMNVANQIAGSVSAKALELLRHHLPKESVPALEKLLQGKQWEDLFHQSISRQMNEVLRALSQAPNMVHQS